tara:strand:+ start:6437 stop:6844 length:408 start_codon:yes stop_codon:yes gene_type:complete
MLTCKDFFFSMALILLITCVNCDGCFSSCDSGPFFADLQIKLTINDENKDVPIEVYRGLYDDGILIIQDTISDDDLLDGRVIYNLEAGLDYAAAATYNDGAKTIIAIDGGEMSLASTECDCDYPTNLTLNLRLAE